MKTIKDLKEAIQNLPDDTPITIYYNGCVYNSNITFDVKKLWHYGHKTKFLVIDRQ